MRVRTPIWTAALLATLVGSAMALAPTSSALTYHYSNSSQTSGNSSGVTFHPHGDRFEIWDNVNDNYAAYVWYNYKGIKDEWKLAGYAKNGYEEVTHNVAETIHGKRAYIYFQVCDRVKQCSTPPWYRTWGK